MVNRSNGKSIKLMGGGETATLRDSQNNMLQSEIRAVPPEHALVMLAGELDVSNVDQLSEMLADLAQKGVRHIALNLAELDFVDSTGLSAIIAAHERAQVVGGELIIFSPQPAIRRLFAVTSVDHYLNIRPLKA
jgi:anti-anti-sigma factor